MSNSNQRHILQLNDDCFYEIFKFLPKIDWCSLRETCTRFQTIADYLFERNHKSFALNPENVYGLRMDHVTLDDAKRLIRNFGQFITKLSINGSHFSNHEDAARLVPLLDRYCHGLRDLKLLAIAIASASCVECNRLFSNLHRLSIGYLKNEETVECCLAHCVSLNELRIESLGQMDGKFLARRFESLKFFTMVSCYQFKSDYVNQFFAQNQQLKKVKIRRSNFHSPNIDLMELSHLKSLDLGLERLPIALPVRRMPSTLKKLKINLNCVKDDIVNQLLADLAVHNNVEKLHLIRATSNDEFVRLLCGLKKLKELKFLWTSGLDGNQCKKLACELPALSEIHVDQCAHTTFNDIKEFVVHSTNLGKIVYDRSCDLHTYTNTYKRYMFVFSRCPANG